MSGCRWTSGTELAGATAVCVQNRPCPERGLRLAAAGPVGVGARRGRRDPARAHGGAVWRWTRRLPCGAHGRGASHNSLRALRALRSDKCDENDHEARCARRPCRCAPRRPTNRPRRVPPAATLGLWSGLRRAPGSDIRTPGARRQRRVGAGRGAPSGAPRRTGLAASAQRVRQHAHRHCLSAESEANAASLAMRPQDRAPQGSRRVQRPTAPVKRRDRSPHAFAAPRQTRRTRYQRAANCELQCRNTKSRSPRWQCTTTLADPA
jgi:hypothetical protein